MNYPFSDADWFAQDLPTTKLYRRVSVGLLTLGHLRTAEAVGVGFIAGRKASALDWGLLITIAQMDWRKARKRASRPSLLWALRRDYNTPRDLDELKACSSWFRAQNYFPARTLQSSSELESQKQASALAMNRASSAIERLALSITRINGWEVLSGYRSVWDLPMITATHLLVANSEIDGAYHVPFDMIKEALQNGKNAT